jgi:hypothetical protein
MIQIVFNYLIVLQFVVVALHDWIEIPGWTHGRQMMAVLGPTKMAIGTVINCLFPGLAAAFAIYFWNSPKPNYALDYWVIYCAVTVLGAITAWWIPYFRGTDEKTTQMYLKMYAGTKQILPPRGDNPRANLLHLYFHVLFLGNLVLSAILWCEPG